MGGVFSNLLSIPIIFSVFFSFTAFAQVETQCSKPVSNIFKFKNNLKVKVINYGLRELKSPHQVALIVPPTGGTNLVDRQYAKFFCRNGLPTVILDKWTGSDNVFDPLDLESHQKEIDYGKKAFLSIVRYLKNTKVAVLSTSKGGIGTSCYFNEFPRNVKSLVTIVAGAPLHLIISRSNQEDLKLLRETRMRKLGIKSYEDYDQAILKSLKSQTASRNPHVKLAMVLANKDFSVPTSLQYHLASRWEPDQIWEFEKSHFMSILFSYGKLRDKIYQFMSDSF